jgi:hypothetical protein
MEHAIATRTRTGAWIQALRTPLALGLAALLVVQLLAAGLLGWSERGTLAPAAVDTALLPFDPKSITTLRIEGSGESVTLARGDRGWLVQDLNDFPAEGSKVDALLQKLADMKRPLPVATSREALKRHKVADDAFERRVTLEGGDKPVATLLLGDSPGFKRQFARPAGEAAVYDLDLALFEVSNRRDDWLARDSLRVDQEQIVGIAAPDWRLVKADDAWTLEGSEAKPDPAAVINLLGRIGSLGYRGVLGTEDKPEYDQATPVVDLSLTLKDGGTREYRISKARDSQDYVLKSGDRPWYFKLSEFDLEGILGVDRAKLLGAAAQPEAAGQSGSADAPAAAGEVQGSSPGQMPEVGQSSPADGSAPAAAEAPPAGQSPAAGGD